MKTLSMSEILRALVFWVGCLEGLGHMEAWAEGQAWFSPLDCYETSVSSCHLTLLPFPYQSLLLQSPHELGLKLGTSNRVL